jgi:hypothetical protein
LWPHSVTVFTRSYPGVKRNSGESRKAFFGDDDRSPPFFTILGVASFHLFGSRLVECNGRILSVGPCEKTERDQGPRCGGGAEDTYRSATTTAGPGGTACSRARMAASAGAQSIGGCPLETVAPELADRGL